MRYLFLLLAFVLGAFAVPAEVTEHTDVIELPSTSRMGFPCANACRLFLCSNPFSANVRPNGSANLLRAGGSPMGGVLCSSSRPIREVHFGEALVSLQRSGRGYVPISSYRPPGLRSRYPTDYFKVYTGSMGVQRITRRHGVGNQYRNVDNLCVTIPIKEYRPTRKSGRVGRRIVTTSAQDCISMRVVASRLQLELTWNNTDDIDISVTEPSGDTIGLGMTESSTGGRFNKDNGVNRCSRREMPGEMTRETVSYDFEDMVESGTYRVLVKQVTSCGSSAAAYKVRAVVNGVVVRTRSGIARLGVTTEMRLRFRRLP